MAALSLMGRQETSPGLKVRWIGVTHLNLAYQLDTQGATPARLELCAERLMLLTFLEPARIVHDTGKPDGTPQKLLDVSRINSLGWKYKTELQDGIMKTYDFFKRNINR